MKYIVIFLSTLLVSFASLADQDVSLCVKSSSPFGGTSCTPVSTTSPLPVTTGGGGGTQDVQGTGTAGTPAGGVLSIQGVGGGTPVPISGSISANTTPTNGTGAYGGVTVTNTSTEMVPAGTAIVFLQIKNESPTATIACNLGLPAVINGAGSITLTPGGSATWDGSYVPGDAVNCISSAASSPATIGAQ